ncbi:hypothetical protein PPO43_15570 [Saprospira sp. CCB-QB6]|uniref:DUF7793 family protein n=1 Tax=Saprospira sp. CCB-QB6 TaxID=3023936 RepID=UPI00234BDA1C|nr:STAS/SEC14 domain-containing protein [Saprospira sp. CCB-QB6]WCL81394.1 hypothetical protein PPO43_15570 [Saprospira sp. CCB-QB6]
MQERNYFAEQLRIKSGSFSWPAGDFIVEQQILPAYYMDNEDAEESLQCMRAMAAARSANIYLLIDMKNIKGASAGARKTLAQASPTLVKGVATLIANPISRLLSNFILGLNKPSYPTRAFSDKEQAKAWLKSLKDKNEAKKI